MAEQSAQRLKRARACRRSGLVPLVLAATLFSAAPLLAQNQGDASMKKLTPKELSPIDLEGYWVAVISEDYVYRMLTPAKGDYASVPLNPHGKEVADQWDPKADMAAGDECKVYGPPGLIRIPGRLHITWQDDQTLKVDFDAGMQTRLLRFNGKRPLDSAPHTRQGYSVAEWQKQAQSTGIFGTPNSLDAVKPGGGGSLGVHTSHMLAGYLRKNGVPYSKDTELQEYWDRITLPNGQEWLIVTSIITDPTYLTEPMAISTNFKREPDGSKWMPTKCGMR